MKLRMKHRGFTLIELLIVVAIIAILAAIAVPNFLQAQTRSKIARVKADMRSLATAIEEYAVDWNRAPIGANEGFKMGIYNDLTRHLECYPSLTTPVAYITTIPKDPFAKFGYVDRLGIKKQMEYFQYNYNWSLPPLMGGNTHFVAALQLGYVWTMVSPGPAGTKSQPTAWQMFGYPITQIQTCVPLSVYDASNGTTSKGYIIRSNKGNYTGNND